MEEQRFQRRSGRGALQRRVRVSRSDPGFSPVVAIRLRTIPYAFRRSADCASPFASALLSRGTCEIENVSDRASFRQVQCNE